MGPKTRWVILRIGIASLCGLHSSPLCSATTWHVSSVNSASDSNPGTAMQPLQSIVRAAALSRPGDTVLFAAGTYSAHGVKVPDGAQDLPIILRSDVKAKVLFTSDDSRDMLRPGSYNTIDGIEFRMTSDHPVGSAINIVRKQHVTIRNCRFHACQVGVHAESSHYLSISSCEMAYSGAYGIHLVGTGQDVSGHRDAGDESRFVEVRNCYLHDAGWNVTGTEGYGFTANGAVENLVIENCQIDNNSGDGILYEDWAVHTTARYNVIRGSGIAGIWIDNASMSVFDNNYLEANNVAVWLSGEDSSNRYRTDFVSIRNNIIVHNDWAFFDQSGEDRSIYGKCALLITSSARDVYFDNNTVAFNKGKRLVGLENRPPQNEFSNIWFRNNIFWNNEGKVEVARGLDPGRLRFSNNLWGNPYQGDVEARAGDPLFVDPTAHNPEGYKLQIGSAARGQGLLLYENQVDLWNGRRPHLSKTGKYDLGAHQYGSAGTARIGLDLAAFPFEVRPYRLQFRARPER